MWKENRSLRGGGDQQSAGGAICAFDLDVHNIVVTNLGGMAHGL